MLPTEISSISPDQFESLFKHRIEVEREFAKVFHDDSFPIPIDLLKTLNDQKLLIYLFTNSLFLCPRRSVELFHAANQLGLPILSLLDYSNIYYFEAYDLGYISKEELLHHSLCQNQDPIFQSLFLPELEDDPIIFKIECTKNDYYYDNPNSPDRIDAKIFYKVSELKKDNWKLLKKLRRETDYIFGIESHKAGEAIYFDNVEQLQILAEQPQFDINCRTLFRIAPSKSGSFRSVDPITLIQLAALNRSIKCFKFLMMKDPDVTDVFQYACAGGSFEIINICLENNFEPGKAVSFAIKYHQNEIAQWLIEEKNFPLDDAIENAFEYGNTEGLLILRRKANIKLTSIYKTFNDESILLFGDSIDLQQDLLSHLHRIISCNLLSVMKFVLNKYKLSKKNVKKLIDTAIYNDNLEALKILINFGYPLPKKLDYAKMNVYNFLIEHGIIVKEKWYEPKDEIFQNLDQMTQEDCINTLLEYTPPLNEKKLLLKQLLKNGYVFSPKEISSLFYLGKTDDEFIDLVFDNIPKEEIQDLVFSDIFSIIPHLAKRGVNFNVYNEEGYTPLHLCIINGNPYSFLQLIQCGADPTLKPKNGKSVFDLYHHNLIYPYADILPTLMEENGFHKDE